jgi:hypothetical protein
MILNRNLFSILYFLSKKYKNVQINKLFTYKKKKKKYLIYYLFKSIFSIPIR